MRRRTSWAALLVASNLLTLGALVCVTVTAAPIVPSRLAPAPDVLSLANIKALRVSVDPMPQDLHDAGITKERVEKAWTDRLRQLGYAVVADEDAPLLRLRAEYLADPNIADYAGVLAFLTFNQDVHVTRLDRHVVLPSYTQYVVGMDRKDQLGPVFGSAIDDMVDDFIHGVREATAYVEALERGR